MIENDSRVEKHSVYLQKPGVHVVFYVVAFIVLIASHQIAPTNLAGPGLDAWVLLFMMIGMIALFFMGLRYAGTPKNKSWVVMIHACGAGLLAFLLLH